MQSNTMSGARTKDKRYIEELERELRNCSLEIGYLQEQLNLRNVESNCMGERVHSLELKLGEVGTLHEKLRLLSEALMQSESRRLSLMQEIKNKEVHLHNHASQIKALETAVSSIALEAQCEVESMKLDIAALEERCFEAERLSQQTAQEKAEMDLLLEMSDFRFQDAQVRINSLEMENKDLKQQLVTYEANADELYCNIMERLDAWLKCNSKMKDQGPGSLWDLVAELKTELPLLKGKCTFQEVNYRPAVSNRAVFRALDDDMREDMEKMVNQIREFELQIVQLKEELRTEKLKAKEEAEDLTQEMAELRYQMTNMLEEECKRRASIEQTSLRRIQDLEEQVRKEKNKCLTEIRHSQELRKLAEMRAEEVRLLKNALEGFPKVTDPETARKIEPCSNYEVSVVSDNLCECSTEGAVDDSRKGHTSHRAVIGWYSDDEAHSTETKCITRKLKEMQMQ